MGVAWVVMKPKKDCPRAKLVHLVENQALCFQLSPTIWYSGDEPLPTWSNLLTHLVIQTYGDADAALRTHVILPDLTTHANAQDFPDVPYIMSVYRIVDNPCFPPLWKLQANRSFLPEDIPNNLQKWQTWVQEIRANKHQPYLIDLMLLDRMPHLARLWEEIHEYAIASFQDDDWTRNEKGPEIREQILQFPRIKMDDVLNRFQESDFRGIPIEPPVLEPSQYESALQNRIDILNKTMNTTRKLFELRQSWNASVRKKWKLNCWYEDEFPSSIKDWIQQSLRGVDEIFLWMEWCASNELGLYLDY